MKKSVLKNEYRMYSLVPYNISPIQQGIQALHGVVEYSQKHFKDADYQEWAKHHKTFIILNGGTTNNGFTDNQGSMQNYKDLLIDNGIKHSVFHEPDLNDALTAVVFLVDERVFDKKKYPDCEELAFDFEKENPQYKKQWEKSIGGKKNVFLREFLSKLRLA